MADCKRLQYPGDDGTVAGVTVRASTTLADVARHAGVHAATVSRVLSRPDMVNVDTLERVRRSVEALGYVPNGAARQLAGGRTSRIAVIVPDVANPYFGALVRSAQRRADDDADLVVLADTDQRPAREIAAVRSLAGDVDGVVLCGSVAAVAELRAAAEGTPLVSVNRRMRSVPSVVVDQSAILEISVAHLRELGHERIGFVRGPAAYWSTEARTRRALDSGVTILGPVQPTDAGGRAVLDSVLDAGITGVIAFNDLVAVGLLGAAAARGLRVPDAFSVVGSDDVPLAAMVHPALTTVTGLADELGRAAVDLVRLHLDERTAHDVALTPSLVVRATTGAP